MKTLKGPFEFVVATLALSALVGWAITTHREQRNEPARFASPEAAVRLTPSMAAFLSTEAVRAHCCSPEKFLNAAAHYELTAEVLPAGDADVIHSLRLASYFHYFAGRPEHARLTMMRAGDVAREQGVTRLASQAYLEAALMALRRRSDQRARDSPRQP